MTRNLIMEKLQRIENARKCVTELLQASEMNDDAWVFVKPHQVGDLLELLDEQAKKDF